MKNFLIFVSIICVLFFIWARIDYKRRKIENNKKKYKPPFRSEEDREEYAKPMEDEHQSRVDFDDAE